MEKTTLFIHYIIEPNMDSFYTTANLINNRKLMFEVLEETFNVKLSDAVVIACYHNNNKLCDDVVEPFLMDNANRLRWGMARIKVPKNVDVRSMICYDLNRNYESQLSEGLVEIIKKETSKLLNPQAVCEYTMDIFNSCPMVKNLHIVLKAGETVFLDTRIMSSISIKDNKFCVEGLPEISDQVKAKLMKTKMEFYLSLDSDGEPVKT
jgi:hypothetical protein